MVLKDIVAPDSRLYAKSEWAPASALWPALSFSQRGVANKFGGLYSQGRDFVITVGTGNPKETLDPAHRQRLMSIVDVAPNVIVATGDLVEPETWRRAQRTTKCESASRISIARYSNSIAKLSRLNFMPGRFRPVDVRGPTRDYTENEMLTHQTGLQQPRIALRRLFSNAGNAIRAYTPCVMMSPMSVALEPGDSSSICL